jgi:hypothetical protein
MFILFWLYFSYKYIYIEMSFQKIVLTIAIIILIVILIVIGVALSKATAAQTWPPVVGACPDYWVDLSGNGEACLNSKSLGKCNIPNTNEKNTMNFNQPPYNNTGSDGLCSKYRWATGCGVTWDGITSGVPNPCTTTTTS